MIMIMIIIMIIIVIIGVIESVGYSVIQGSAPFRNAPL